MTALASFLATPGGLALGGLLLGVAFGAVVYASNFCVMGALSDVVNLGDRKRLGAWLLAIATAMFGVELLRATGGLPIEKSMYLSPRLNWFGHVVGGVIFGFGMVLSGGCPTRNLVRVGAGDLRALITLLVIAVAGFITIGGLLAPVRDLAEQHTAIDLKRFGLDTQSAAAIVARIGGLARSAVSSGLALFVSGALVVWALKDKRFRSSSSHILAGLAVGAMVVIGWAMTGAAYDEFAQTPVAPVSLTFIRPLGDTLDWLQRFTALPVPGFGIACVLGTLTGAFLMARGMGRFRAQGFSDLGDMQRTLTGAALMGIGGAMALGCTVGQGITGLSTLAVGSILTTVALVVGGFAGLRYLERIAGD